MSEKPKIDPTNIAERLKVKVEDHFLDMVKLDAKPMEFWLFQLDAFEGLHVREVTRPQPDDIHVIEKSYADSLAAELEAVKAENQKLLDDNTTMHVALLNDGRFDEDMDEIVRLKSEIEILCSKESQFKSTVMATVEERDRLQAELEKGNAKWEKLERDFYLTNDHLARQNEILKEGLEFYADAKIFAAAGELWRADSEVSWAVQTVARKAIADAEKVKG